MTDTAKDSRLILVLTKRLETQRPPMALSLKSKVDRGDTLNDVDPAYLKEVNGSAAGGPPSGMTLRVSKMPYLYEKISAMAVVNEKTR